MSTDDYDREEIQYAIINNFTGKIAHKVFAFSVLADHVGDWFYATDALRDAGFSPDDFRLAQRTKHSVATYGNWADCEEEK